jgi:RHS repeat-associated protein
VSATGAVSDRYAYDPYGNVTASSGSVANPWQFAGGYYDASTGLTKFGNRYYDSTSGRWTQADTLSGNLSNPQSLNRFVYAGDNPVNEVDPSGLCSFSNCLNTITSDGGKGAFYGAAGGCVVGGVAAGVLSYGIGAIPGCLSLGGDLGVVGAVTGAVVGIGQDIASFF